jgi:hypothetical protein
MNDTITIGELIAVGLVSILFYAFIKTLLETITHKKKVK